MRKDFSSARCGGAASQLASFTEPVLLGDINFIPSPTVGVTDYTVRVYAFGTSTPVVASLSLGVPPTNPYTGLIRANIATFLNAIAPGDYVTTIVTTGPGGPVESVQSSPFTIPLA